MTTTAAAIALPPLVPEEGGNEVLSGWTSAIDGLSNSGHQKLEFLVYRMTYDNEGASTRFTDVLTCSTEVALRQIGKDVRLQPYLEQKVVEVYAIFDRASKDTVHEHF